MINPIRVASDPRNFSKSLQLSADSYGSTNARSERDIRYTIGWGEMLLPWSSEGLFPGVSAQKKKANRGKCFQMVARRIPIK